VRAASQREWLSLGVGLLVVLTAIISAATISVGSAGYISVFLPLPTSWIISGVVIAMGLVACLATVQSVTFAGIMTLVEVGGLLLIIVAGLGHGSDVVTRLPELWPSSGGTAAWAGIAGTAMVAVFAFIGFEHLVNIAEELKEPNRTLPRALFLTLGLTAVLYALVVWIAVTAVAPKYQCAEMTRSARGRGSCRPNARHASVYPFVSSAFKGLPWPTNSAGMRSICDSAALGRHVLWL